MGIARFASPGGRFRASATTLKFLLEWAYGIQPSQHSGGPSWVETDRYEIIAKAGDNATEDQMKLMVQTLLADRFKLKLHHERKDLSVQVISLGKSPLKFFPPKEGETHAIVSQASPGDKALSFHLVFTRFTLGQFTDLFARQLGMILVNQTGLDGEFDFTLDLTLDDSRPNQMDPSILISAMREQLGLTLKSQRLPVDILVIDSAEKVAAGN